MYLWLIYVDTWQKPTQYFKAIFPQLKNKQILEKEMATHSSTLAWKIPWTEEPGRLKSMRSQRVGHD